MRMSNVTCDRCNGKGWLEQFKNVNGGECFKCNASGIIGGTVKLPKPKFNTYSDEAALKNAFKRINNERAEKRKAFLEWKAEEEGKEREHQEYLANEYESFTWDD